MKSPIDISVMEQFFDDKQDIVDMLDLLIQETANDITVMKSCCDSDDKSLWYSKIHKIKGVSGTAGATALYDICKRAEVPQGLVSGNYLEITNNIEEELARVVDFIDDFKS